MIKAILLSSAMLISSPVLAQGAPNSATPSTTTGSAPAQSASPSSAPASSTPVQAAPSPDSAAQAAAAPNSATAAPQTKQEQVAAVVNQEFPTYDANKDGKLDTAEFGSWMVALKTASDPATKADSPATKTWIGQAFASADTDRNKSVSMTELNTFLSKG